MRPSFRKISRWLAVLLLTGVVGLPVLEVSTPAAMAAREPQTPEEMYQLGVRMMNRGNYQRAVELFERVKTRYPFSQYAVLSELRIGDTFFKKGEFPEAVDAFQTFLKLHPRHAEVDYVIYKIAQAEFEQAPSIAQRDQVATKRMLAATQTFNERFPGSKYAEDVGKMRRSGYARLAKGVLQIGDFYYRRGRFQVDAQDKVVAWEAAIRRYEQVLDEYPEATDLGATALYRIGLVQARMHRKAEASETLERLKQRFPDATRYTLKLTARVNRISGEPMRRLEPGETPPVTTPTEAAPEGAPAPEEAAPEGSPEETAPEISPEAAPEGSPEEAAPETPEETTPGETTPDEASPEVGPSEFTPQP